MIRLPFFRSAPPTRIAPLSTSAHEQLERLLGQAGPHPLQSRLVGLEKENLRTTPDGTIALSSHPESLGSTLTHPAITTDYAEAQLELVTPPFEDVASSLVFLDELQRFIQAGIGEELLWAASMPCVVAGDEGIRIATYGSSNEGLMRHIYRRGLGYRYGRTMQVITGIHLNFSMGEDFWRAWHQSSGDQHSLREFRDQRYMGLVRNQQRLGWLVPYLFGCSPAVCNSFLRDVPGHSLSEWDDTTSYGPYATSLRMSDIGYQNRRSAGLRVSYNTLEQYVADLERAIRTPWPDYQKIGVVVDGEYRQLNANILQIENEYYSSMRPKPPADSSLSPAAALREHGIAYVELRSLDLNMFEPLGVSEQQLRFLELFLLYCLLEPSPDIEPGETTEIDANQSASACNGRDPALMLQRRGQAIALREWAAEIMDALTPLAEALDAGRQTPCYLSTLASVRPLCEDPALTPSGRMLAQMAEREQGFFSYAMDTARQYRQHYLDRPLGPERMAAMQQQARDSLAEQSRREATTEPDFASWLANRYPPADRN